MRKLIHTLLTFLLLLSASNTAWAEVKAFLNQDTFFEGDPITLTLETSGNGNTKPDLSPLEKDFDILGTSTSTQVNILNGHKRVKKGWTIELQPKRKGAFQIPIIQIGQETTLAIDLKIIDIPPNVEKETKEHVFVESSVDIAGDQPYVQQQIPYTVKLYYDENIRSVKIYSPTVENAVVEQLGEDRRYRTIRKGKKYSVVEKHFVISPEKSGKLHIPPTSVKGRMNIASSDKPSDSQNKRRDNQDTDFLNRFFNNSPFSNDPFFSDFGGDFFSNRRSASKPFTASSEAIDVNVQSLPAAFKGQLWLPAEELTIEDSWATMPPELRVGEPVTRVLRLRAKGLAGSQIPKIEIPKPNNIRTYPEQEKTETRTDGKTVYGISEMNISYIPDASGKITIPEIKLDWWNVITKKQQTFILPEWNLSVAEAIGGATPPINTSDNVINNNASNTVLDSNKTESSDGVSVSNNDNWLYWLLALFALIATAGLSYFYRVKRNNQPTKNIQNNTHPANNTKAIKAALQQACSDNQQHEAAKHLLKLANVSWKGDNPPQNLGALATQFIQGKEAILELQRSLYAKNNLQWDGTRLWNAVKNGLQEKSIITKQHDTQLKPLYPT